VVVVVVVVVVDIYGCGCAWLLYVMRVMAVQ
jgi:hypothetical protein